MSCAALDHSLSGQLAAEHYTVDIDVKNATGDFVGFVHDRAGRHDARVVDQNVDRAHLPFDLIEEVAERLRVGDVSLP